MCVAKAGQELLEGREPAELWVQVFGSSARYPWARLLLL